MNEHQKKLRVEKNGKVHPLVQLKLQPPEIHDWAYDLRDQHSLSEIREMIRAKTGIALTHDYAFTRFCYWYEQQTGTSDGIEMAHEFQRFCKEHRPDLDPEQVREGMMSWLMNQAVAEKNSRLMLWLVSENRRQARFEFQRETEREKALNVFWEEIKAQPPERREQCKKLFLQFTQAVTEGKAKEEEQS